MFTERYMFSNNFVASATLGDDTGTVLTITLSYNSCATFRQFSVTPPTTFGIVEVVCFLLFGSSRSGL